MERQEERRQPNSGRSPGVGTAMGLFLFSLVILGVLRNAMSQASWMDATKSPLERAQLILQQMSLEEKIMMLHGNSSSNPDYVGYIAGNTRLGIPAIKVVELLLYAPFPLIYLLILVTSNYIIRHADDGWPTRISR